MSHGIEFAPEAARDYRDLDAHAHGVVRDAIETRLRHEPTKTSRSRIKRLRGLQKPQYHLRVGDLRVFYDVAGSTVQVLAIVSKARAHEWLEKRGKRS